MIQVPLNPGLRLPISPEKIIIFSCLKSKKPLN